MTDNREFKALLALHGLTAHRLHKLLGIPESTVNCWNNGTRKPSPWLLRLIDKVLTYELKGE